MKLKLDPKSGQFPFSGTLKYTRGKSKKSDTLSVGTFFQSRVKFVFACKCHHLKKSANSH